ncbi:putative bifunctional diguanylate cyclase/phosphodiesterase [Cellulomonas aerilata]|uniref:putative bifunctional diguanylate cyclase/phosphodiesterase n=1 Tax=Cellulomonas aerilata TaxID=515326 RepID=UPI0011BEC6F5|nr:EAL domain-containing protein [Cellulomonas aerilata]
MVLRLVADRLGEHGVETVLRTAGLEGQRELLESRTGRVGYETKVAVFAAATQVLDDPRFGFHLAALMLHDPAFALVRSLVAVAGSPRQVLRYISRVSTRFDTAAVFRCEFAGTTSARVAWEVLAPNRAHRVDCDYNMGMLQQVPVLFGLPPATVRHEACQLDGAPECRYHVAWTAGGPVQRARSWWHARATATGEAFDAGQYEVRIAGLEAAGMDVVNGGPLTDVLHRIASRANSALHAPGHLLAVTLPSADTHVHRAGVGAALEPAIARLQEAVPGVHVVAGHPVVTASVASATNHYGVLAVVGRPGQDFFPHDADTLAAYARHAAAALQVSAGLTHAEQEAQTATLLLDVARTLPQHRSVPAVADAVADAVPPLTSAQRSAFALVDPDTRAVTIAGKSGWPDELVAKVERYVTNPDESPELCDQLLRGPEPVLLDSRSSPWAREMLASFEVEAMAAVPVAHHGQLLGLLLAHWVTGAPDQLDEILTTRLSGLAGLAAVALDNTRLLEQARRQALHDPLTDLPNRVLLEDRLDQALAAARRTATRVGLLFCDVNRFKRVNDTLGHAAGDELLRRLAHTLRTSVRDGDTVARLSGDEFVVLLPHVHDDGTLREVTANIRAQLAEPIAVAGNDIYVNMAIGLAISDGWTPGSTPKRPKPAADLIARADREMYVLKARTRGLPTPMDGGADRLRLETDLHDAAARGELVVHYQPQTDARSGQVLAVEALVRWQHPELGMVPPSVFIPIAEDSGAIDQIGAHVLRQACRTVTDWYVDGLPLEVAVNVSASQLHSDSFADLVRTVLQETGLAAHRLVLEVTETQVVADAASGTHLRALRDLGVGISVDDFGTGYSSLAQLRRLPATELKIDQSFTTELPDSAAFVSGIIALAHSLGLRVVAEGVERPDQLQALIDAGCDRAQGYLLGRPAPRPR